MHLTFVLETLVRDTPNENKAQQQSDLAKDSF